jgi:hypothetical protein
MLLFSITRSLWVTIINRALLSTPRSMWEQIAQVLRNRTIDASGDDHIGLTEIQKKKAKTLSKLYLT